MESLHRRARVRQQRYLLAYQQLNKCMEPAYRDSSVHLHAAQCTSAWSCVTCLRHANEAALD
eukprot:scaffold195466_cov20-Prasinocladus_malaysianus.AAC.2